jgi:archaeoflavoprotein AfpA
MPAKIVWGITGAGDLISEIFEVMEDVSQMKDLEINAVLSKAAVTVLKWYKLQDKLDKIAKRVFVEKDANTPFVVGPLQVGQYDGLLIAPVTANSVAKIVSGIADTLITNAISQTNKTNMDIYLLPVDQKKGTTTTILPGNEKLELTIRDIDVDNTNRLKNMKGIIVLEKPQEIKRVVAGYL